MLKTKKSKIKRKISIFLATVMILNLLSGYLGIIVTYASNLNLGQTIYEDEIYPSNTEIEKSIIFLSENHINIPDDVKSLCEKYGEKYDICPELLEAICWIESNCISKIDNPDGSCKGIMQIKPSSHAKRIDKLNVSDIYDTESNIYIASDYIAELRNDYADDNLAVTLMLYNGDTNGVNKYMDGGEPSDFVNKVLKVSNALENIHFAEKFRIKEQN